MAAAAITKTKDAALNTQSTIASHNRYGGKFEYGNIAIVGSYVSGGVAITFPDFKKVKVLLCENRGGYMYEYDSTNKKLIVRTCAVSNAAGVVVQATVSLSALSNIPYVAIGY